MIEQIRKYSGLSIVVLAVVFISFFFMDTQSMQGPSGSPTVMRIDGRGYSEKDYLRLGSGGHQIITGVAQSGDFALFQAFMPLFGRGGGEDTPKQLFINRVLLQRAQEKFGIHPSDDEISSYIRKMRAFAGQDGSFDPEIYGKFVEGGMRRLGLAEHDLREIASDAIVAQKLQSILSSGLNTDRDAIARESALNEQQITVELGRLDLDTYQDKIDPKEEEIKAYWEGIQDSFKTEPLKKFTYVIVTPEAVADAAPEAPAAPLPADATEEAKAAAKKAEEDKKAAAAAKTAEARRENQNKVDVLVDDFRFTLVEQAGAGFEDLAKKNGWEVKTTELFSQSTPPADLNIDLRSSSQGGKAADILFRMTAGKDAASRISDPIAVGEGQWLVARLDAEEAPRVKTYAEARADARAQYILEKGTEALKTAADEAAKKIKEGLAAKKSFADAAKEAGLTEVKTVEKVTRSYRPDALSEPQGLFEEARATDSGSLTNNIVESDRAFIVYVVKREVIKEENAAARLDAEVSNSAAGNAFAAFNSWLASENEAAKVEDLFSKQ
jgi:peptidyl-prolyl cis-trans isomerase D